MKNRSLILKTAAVTFSLTLLATYVVARATGLIGRGPEPAAPITSVPNTTQPSIPTEAKQLPVRESDYFVGSKSGPIVMPKDLQAPPPKKFPDLIPGQTTNSPQPK